MDVHEPDVRSYNMRQIKGKNTAPEMIVRKFLHKNGFRYGLYSRYLPGKPDIVLRRYKIIVDVRGCFWHGHANCKFGDHVNTSSVVVTNKINSAIERDKIKAKKWKKLGWNVIVIWDSCELESKKKKSPKRDRILLKLILKLKKLDSNY